MTEGLRRFVLRVLSGYPGTPVPGHGKEKRTELEIGLYGSQQDVNADRQQQPASRS